MTISSRKTNRKHNIAAIAMRGFVLICTLIATLVFREAIGFGNQTVFAEEDPVYDEEPVYEEVEYKPDESCWQWYEGEEDGVKDGTITIYGYNDRASYSWDDRELDKYSYRLIVPDNINGKKVTFVGSDSGDFLDTCRMITSIVIPEGVTEVGRLVTEYDEVSYVSLPSTLKKITHYTFSTAKYLKSITIPDGVTFIDDEVFRYCESLESITLPSELRDIGSKAFYGCDSLKTVKIPAKVNYIGEGAFSDCQGLESFEVEEGNEKFYAKDGILYSKSIIKEPVYGEELDEDGDPIVESYKEVEKKRLVSYPCAKEGTVTLESNMDFEWTAFINTKKLTAINVEDDNPYYTSLDGVLYKKDMSGLLVCPAGKTGEYTVPEGVYYLQSNAFSSTALTSLSLPDTLCSSYDKILGFDRGFIGYNFYSDTLQSIHIGKSVEIDDIKSALWELNNLSNITVSEDSPYLSVERNILYDKDKKILYGIPLKLSGKIVLPDTVEQSKLSYNFYGIDFEDIDYNITEIVLGKNYKVEVKEYYEYYDDNDERTFLYHYAKGIPKINSLQAYSVSQDNEMLTAQDGLLYSKDGKTLYACPPAKQGEIKIADGTTTILGESFYGYQDQAEDIVITIPDSVTTIEQEFRSGTIIKGYSGSAAEEYVNRKNALGRNITFVSLGNSSAKPSVTTQPQVTYQPVINQNQNISSSGKKPVISGTSNIGTTQDKPKKIKSFTVKSGKRKVKASWKSSNNRDVTYEIQYALNRKFTKGKERYYVYFGKKKATIYVKKMKKTYYFRIRAYKYIDGRIAYSSWSSVKKCKVK